MYETRQRVVAAFDFDGTLTRRDTLIPFLRFLCGNAPVIRTLTAHGLPLSAAIARDHAPARTRIKEQVLRELLAGRDHDDVKAAGTRFANLLTAGSKLRTDVVSRWRWHRYQGHEIVVVSAGLEAYVTPFAELLGGAEVLGTRLNADGTGKLTGKLDGFNCYGAEKVRRLREWGVSPDIELWAYGNSSGDRELLTIAAMPHRVGRGAAKLTPFAQGRPMWRSKS